MLLHCCMFTANFRVREKAGEKKQQKSAKQQGNVIHFLFLHLTSRMTVWLRWLTFAPDIKNALPWCTFKIKFSAHHFLIHYSHPLNTLLSTCAIHSCAISERNCVQKYLNLHTANELHLLIMWTNVSRTMSGGGLGGWFFTAFRGSFTPGFHVLLLHLIPIWFLSLIRPNPLPCILCCTLSPSLHLSKLSLLAWQGRWLATATVTVEQCIVMVIFIW